MANTTDDDDSGDDGDGGDHSAHRSSTPASPSASASETIADLWRQREEQLAAARPVPPPPPPPRTRSRRAPAPESPAGKPRFGVGTMVAVVVGALVLAGGVGYLLAGRGGGASRGSFIARADAICRPADAMLAITRPSSYPELATAATIFSTAAEGELGQLRQVPQPGGSAGAEARTVVDDFAATTAAARGLHEAAVQKDDAATVAAMKQLSTAAADTAGASGAYGMTACGSGLLPTVQTLSQGAQSVVKAGLVARADALCRAASDEFDELGDPSTDDLDDLHDYLEAALVIQVRVGDGLRALPVPPGDEATVAEMLAALDQVTAKARALTEAVGNADQSGVIVALREITTLGTTADARLDGYGLGVCGSNFGNI